MRAATVTATISIYSFAQLRSRYSIVILNFYSIYLLAFIRHTVAYLAMTEPRREKEKPPARFVRWRVIFFPPKNFFFPDLRSGRRKYSPAGLLAPNVNIYNRRRLRALFGQQVFQGDNLHPRCIVACERANDAICRQFYSDIYTSGFIFLRERERERADRVFVLYLALRRIFHNIFSTGRGEDIFSGR